MAKCGFLGLGIMGAPMAANLLRAGHELIVWNRTADKCGPLVDLGARQAESAAAVAAEADLVFAMLADPAAAERVVFGPAGVLEGLRPGTGYIDMSTVDEITSRNISTAVGEAEGRFLEAPVSGTKKPAEDGTLIILAAGDRSLYEEAARMKLVVNMIMGGMMSSFCEGLALGSKGGLATEDILDVLSAGALANPMFSGKGPLIRQGDFSPAFPLKHMQKDLRLATELGDILSQSLPSAAAANQTFIRARAAGLGDEDFCAVFKIVSDET